jgi:hypothetical protein
VIERYTKRTPGAACCTTCGKWITWPFDEEPKRGRCACEPLTKGEIVDACRDFVARGGMAQAAVDALTLKPALRTCNVCGHQTEKGAGKGGNLCPLLACPGDLR